MQAATLTAGLAAGFALGQAARRLACLPESSASEAVLPGDDLLPAAPVQVDRIVTVRAAPEAVWPWIAQLGQHRAGFYTLPVIDRAIGCNPEAASRIHPEWQDVHAGNPFPVAPFVTLQVAAVRPGEYLVLTTQGATIATLVREFCAVDSSWAIVLHRASAATRLHVRSRWQPHDTRAARLLPVIRAVTAVMTAVSLRRIRALATQNA
ncbi:hypothetical protein [Brevibacterium luteolum]|uniref:hypothetical protein n=1 Tax=Brevibacterium luteolum TaxID=199591 RepID=UPI001C24EAEC|nr:hypothetical protein [Brevibacterium luteolum]MBU8578718.1 hypothetical protein [Brevibacterium luteolum]